jgi:hypothetical protein
MHTWNRGCSERNRASLPGASGQCQALFAYVDRCLSGCAGRPAVTITLDAGGADTYAYRAIPGIWAQLDRICFKDVGLISTPSPCDLYTAFI